jgi:hypothetical protein
VSSVNEGSPNYPDVPRGICEPQAVAEALVLSMVADGFVGEVLCET